MDVRFILHSPNADKPTYIFLFSSVSDGRIKYSTGEKILPADWSCENQRPKNLKSYKALNKTLSDIDSLLTELSESLKLTGKKIKKADVTKCLDDYFGKSVNKSSKVDFHQVITNYIEDCKSGRRLTKKGKKFSKETTRGYKHCQDKFKEYETARKKKLSFESITMETVNDMIHFYNSQDLSLNAVGKIIKNLKVFLTNTVDIHGNPVGHQIKPPAEETPDIYLNEKDLDAIYKVKLKEDIHNIVRDRFIMDCYLGLRISDLKLVSSDNIQGDFIVIANEKTDSKVVIPQHPRVKEILKKYKGMPPKVSDQEMNRSLKSIALKAKLNEKFLYTLTKGGVRKDHYLHKWEMVSNHTARRTFITNLLKAGISSSIVMKLAGIRKAQTLERYNKISEEENAILIAEHPFFK